MTLAERIKTMLKNLARATVSIAVVLAVSACSVTDGATVIDSASIQPKYHCNSRLGNSKSRMEAMIASGNYADCLSGGAALYR